MYNSPVSLIEYEHAQTDYKICVLVMSYRDAETYSSKNI